MSAPRRRTAGFLVCLIALVVPQVAQPSVAAPDPYCSLGGMTTHTWTGAGDGLSWTDPANWNGGIPDNSEAATGYVCIDDGGGDGLVVIGDGEHAEVQAFDIAPGTTLRMAKGSKIFVHGDHATRPSVIRAGAAIEVLGATLGGPGRVDLLGTMTWRSLVDGAATISSRGCGVTATCPGPVVGTPGKLVVADGALLAVDGRGVNLEDEYVVVVHGVMRLTNDGYIAADRGTSFELRPKTGSAGRGMLDIRNDGGFYEGRTLNGVTTLASLVNEGTILKGLSSGTSVVDAAYSRVGAGQVWVRTGTLTLPMGATHAATVSAGKTFGSGTCPTGEYGCTPETYDTDRQFGRLTVPTRDTSGAAVQVRELAARSTQSDIGFPVLAHASGLDATRRAPARITLRYDSRLLDGRGWRAVKVYRKAQGATRFVVVPACLADGRPPSGSVACVDRRGRVGSSRNVYDAEGPDAKPDVVMVVRTIRTSRWVAR